MTYSHFKLCNKIISWQHFKEPEVLQVFIFLLARANFEETFFDGRTIKRGQLPTSYNSIMAHTGLSMAKARKIIDKLIASGEIEKENCIKFSLITIKKYDIYQTPKDWYSEEFKKKIGEYERNRILLKAYLLSELLSSDEKLKIISEIFDLGISKEFFQKKQAKTFEDYEIIPDDTDDTQKDTEDFDKYEKEQNMPLNSNDKLKKVKALSDWTISNPDLAFDKTIHKLFELYEQYAKSLIPLRFEKRNNKTYQLAKEYLIETACDYDYFVELIKKANQQRTILGNKIDFQALLKNHQRIFSEFYGQNPTKKTSMDDKMEYFNKVFGITEDTTSETEDFGAIDE